MSVPVTYTEDPSSVPPDPRRGIVVIGAGPIGASTARWLAEGGHQVSIIGPVEPEDHRHLTGTWSGHYDQGRLAAVDAMYVPALLGLRSGRRYEELSQRSGIEFTSPMPLLTPFPEHEATTSRDPQRSGWRDLDALLANAAELGVHAELLDREAMARRLPQLRVPEGQVGVLQDDCVLVNPRQFTRAELVLAARAGATRHEDEATAIEAGSAARWRVRLRSGESVEAEQVVVAVGAYTNASRLLAPHTDAPLAISVHGCTIVLLEVPEPDGVDFPGYMYSDDHYGGGLITPPRQYPDGAYYLKCASGELMDHPLGTQEEITDWVRSGGSATEIDWFRDYVAQVLPGVRVGRGLTKPCLPTFNSTGLPFIDTVAEGIVVVTEGERGVWMGDEIGRLAAGLATEGRWIDPMPSQLFSVAWAT